MSDLIRREDVEGALQGLHVGDTRFFEKLRKALDEIPSAEPERKKGKWEYPRKFGHAHLLGKCSVCGKYEGAEWIALDNPNFCPHCGAEME